jgi:hypothetical protein
MLIPYSLPVSKANSESYVEGQHTGVRLMVQLKDVLDRFVVTDGHLFGIKTEGAS